MIFKALKQSISKLYPQRISTHRFREALQHQLALIGGRPFGPLADGVERSFYIRDRSTVVWKEGELTTYYQFTPDGLVKSQNGQVERPSDEEVRRLLHALRWYRQQVFQYLQKLAPQR